MGVITSWDKFLLAASKQIPGSRNYELIEDANITKNTVKIVNFYTDYAKHQLQYSSNKNFKDAKTITKSGGNVKKYTRKSIVIKGLKPNTTYYFRQRYKAAV